MHIGPVVRDRLPKQDAQVVNLLIDRFERAAAPHAIWATEAKKAVEYFEGKQWDEAARQILNDEGRPALTFNVIKPLVKLVMGYQRSNKTDVTFLPSNDASGTEIIADALSETIKHVQNQNKSGYRDTEVFLDGLLSGRAFWDIRLNFERNDLGDIKMVSSDPFATYIDPDADQYEPDQWNYLVETKWMSLDEIEFLYGGQAAQYGGQFVGGGSWGAMPSALLEAVEDIRPATTFGLEGDDSARLYSRVHDRLYDYVDTMRKTIRILDYQYYVYTDALVFIDLETGRRVLVPSWMSREQIMAISQYNAERGNPVRLSKRKIRRVRWTTLLGDLMIHDDWSPFRSYTKIPFFPYFRRGVTRGMIEDLIDPQDEINKRSSAELNIVMRTSKGLWLIPKGALTPENREALEEMGGRAGLTLEWDPNTPHGQPPAQVGPVAPPIAMERLQSKSEERLHTISGINLSATGELDRVQSGRAIEARQRQSILGMEPDLDNYSRSQELKGTKLLEVAQDFYTEPRLIRIRGEDGIMKSLSINEVDPVTREIKNNIGLGTYVATVDETPMSATYLQATFEEMLDLRDRGIPIPDDMVIDASSMGRKQELKERLQAVLSGQEPLPQGAGVAPNAAPGTPRRSEGAR